MSTLMIIGAVSFFIGGLSFMALLFGNGGWQRARQFAVIGQLLSGGLGSGRRMLAFVSLALIGVGVLGCFAGVASMDVERANRCQNQCIAAGYDQGIIGASKDRNPATRFVACTCTAANREPIESRANQK